MEAVTWSRSRSVAKSVRLSVRLALGCRQETWWTKGGLTHQRRNPAMVAADLKMRDPWIVCGLPKVQMLNMRRPRGAW